EKRDELAPQHVPSEEQACAISKAYHFATGWRVRKGNQSTPDPNVRDGSRLCKNVFPPPKTARNQGRSASTRWSEHIFALSGPESTRARARATLSDLNGHTMRMPARALHARIATRSGLMPTMFVTRVRL